MDASRRLIAANREAGGKLPAEIAELEGKADSPKLKKELETEEGRLVAAKRDLALYTAEAFQLPAAGTQPVQQGVHHQCQRSTLSRAQDASVQRRQWRRARDDGAEGRHPSPIPCRRQERSTARGFLAGAARTFFRSPGAPWYGAWYLAEALDILTQNPNVWKKTIFVLAYDENDGYFDHVPPFVVPDPARPETGKTSPGIDASNEYNKLEATFRAINRRMRGAVLSGSAIACRW